MTSSPRADERRATEALEKAIAGLVAARVAREIAQPPRVKRRLRLFARAQGA